MNEDGFWIQNLDEYEELLKSARAELPAAIKNMLESLGEELLNLAKLNMRSTNFPHAVFKRGKTKVTRDSRGRIKKGSNRITSIQYAGSENRNMIDQGGLWNSLQRGGRGNKWTFSGGTGTFRLNVGSTVKYAKFVHDGYTIKRDHWVPGVVDSNGIFRYKKGAKTGIMARARTFKGIPFFEIALKDLETVAPDIVKKELQSLFGRLT